MDVREDLLIGYKLEFMPSDLEILLIGQDIAANGEDSKYRKLVQKVDMYDISFIDRLATADRAIKVKNQFLITTDRSPNPRGQGFARTVYGGAGGYWTPNHGPAEIKNLAGEVKGYKRELVFYIGGKGAKGGTNSHWTMQEYYGSKDFVKENIICTVSYEDVTIKKELAVLKDGVAAARSFRSKALAPRKGKVAEPGNQNVTLRVAEVLSIERKHEGCHDEKQVAVVSQRTYGSRLAKLGGKEWATSDDEEVEDLGNDNSEGDTETGGNNV